MEKFFEFFKSGKNLIHLFVCIFLVLLGGVGCMVLPGEHTRYMSTICGLGVWLVPVFAYEVWTLVSAGPSEFKAGLVPDAIGAVAGILLWQFLWLTF